MSVEVPDAEDAQRVVEQHTPEGAQVDGVLGDAEADYPLSPLLLERVQRHPVLDRQVEVRVSRTAASSVPGLRRPRRRRRSGTRRAGPRRRTVAELAPVRRSRRSRVGETEPVSTPEQQPHRSGFVALVGRPNAGKTTLTNALVGEKVGIVSNRPQTTRHAIRGVVHRPGGQIVLVDTPGLHKPKSLLGKRLNDVVRDMLSDVDVIVFCVPADQPRGRGRRVHRPPAARGEGADRRRRDQDRHRVRRRRSPRS